MKIGLYFGSFNPIHNGHIKIANYVAKQVNLDKLLLIVSPNNPFKDKKELADVDIRLQMAYESTLNMDKIEISAIETLLPTPSYTINTINKVIETYGTDNDYQLIIGFDNWIEFDKWRNFDEILSKTSIIVLPRLMNGVKNINQLNYIFNVVKCRIQEKSKALVKSTFLKDAPLINISSTEIRKNILDDNFIKKNIPSEAYKIIKEQNLYH